MIRNTPWCVTFTDSSVNNNTARSASLSVKLQNRQQHKKTRPTPRTSSLNQLAFNDHGSGGGGGLRPGLWNEALRSRAQIVAQQHHHGTSVTSCITAGVFIAWLGVYFESGPIKACFVLPLLLLSGESVHKNRKTQKESISVWDFISLFWLNIQNFREQN